MALEQLQSRSTVQPSNLVNSRDHGAYVTVTAILCLIFSLLFVAARLSVRWPSKATLGRDDYVAPVALVATLVQSILILADVSVGLGRPSEDLGPATATTVLRMYYACDLLFVVSLASGRVAVALLLSRLSNEKKSSRVAIVIAAASALYGCISFLMVAIRAPSAPPTGIFPRWIAVSAMGSTLDLAIAIFPLSLVWGLSMKVSAQVTVIASFAIRLPIIALSAIRILSLSALGPESDFTFDLAYPTVWAQLEMHYNLVAAIVPCLRIFLRVWDTHLLRDPIYLDGHLSRLDATGATVTDPLGSKAVAAVGGHDGVKRVVAVSVSHSAGGENGEEVLDGRRSRTIHDSESASVTERMTQGTNRQLDVQ